MSWGFMSATLGPASLAPVNFVLANKRGYIAIVISIVSLFVSAEYL